jgi:hypothetical protein
MDWETLSTDLQTLAFILQTKHLSSYDNCGYGR